MPRLAVTLVALAQVISIRCARVRHKAHQARRNESEISNFGATAACPNPVDLSNGIGCKCTGAAGCGTLQTPSVSAGAALVIKSSKDDGYWMTETVQTTATSQLPDGWLKARIQVQAGAPSTPQPIEGFGGAFTDAMAYQYELMDAATKDAFIQVHFGDSGLGYSMGRTHMGGSDFSRMDYVLVNKTDDFELESFCLRDDTAKEVPCGTDYKLAPILAAQAALRASEEPELGLFVSMWAPPHWIKDQRMTCVTHQGIASCSPDKNREPLFECSATVDTPCEGNPLKERCPQSDGSVFNDPVYPGINPGIGENWAEELITHNARGNCYYTGMVSDDPRRMQALADMYKKFIEAYAEKGVPMWGMTIQNEPLKQDGLWNAMFWTAELQAAFVKILGPTMRAALPDLKIIIHDDTPLELRQFAGAILDDAEAAQYVDGIGFHWYHAIQGLYENSPEELPLGFIGDIANIPFVGGGEYVRTMTQQHPDKFFMMTEACNGYLLDQGQFQGPSPGNWGYGYSYSHDIMWQLKNGATGWIDWNLILDMEGGPNHNGNQVDAPTLREDASTFYLNPSFYHMAHFSRVLPRGSRVVESRSVFCDLRHTCDNHVAFVTPAEANKYPNSLVFVITNDEITECPQYAGGAGTVIYPDLACGQGTLTLGTKEVHYSVGCDNHGWVQGKLAWKAIDTVVIPCGDRPCSC